MSRHVEHTDVPIYAISYDPASKRMLAAGGGGSSKTGLKNQIMMYSVDPREIKLTKSAVLSTSFEAPMNLAVNPKNPAEFMCGVNDRCWYVAIRDGQMALQKSIQTDFSDVPEGGYQKVVAFSPKGSKCVTGGTDGHVSFWSFPDLKKKSEVSAKVLDEILDIAFVDKTCFFITAKALVACDLNGVVLKEVGASEGFSFRCLQTFDGQVIAICNSKDRKQCQATYYSVSDLSLAKTFSIRSLRAVTCVAQSGDFVALGSATGAIGLFRISDFRLIKVIDNYHGFAITSLAMAQHDSSSVVIFSGSTDSTIRMVKMSTKPSSSFLTLLLLFLAMLALAIAVAVNQYPERTQEIIASVDTWCQHLLQEFKQHLLIKQ